MKTKVNLDVEDIGAQLAHEDDNDQADMISAMAEELDRCCDTGHLRDLQLLAIANNLSPQGRGFISGISQLMESEK